jgi:asparagine synthase (glutamine-hydrolysing)
MCGILGSINVPLTQSDLDMLRHRGPDGYGLTHVDVGADRAWLGHRRLSIVDLSPAGAQPMTSACGRYHLVFNGEVYNHLDLRRQLPGVAFRGHSDTETILYYLMRYGIDGLPALNGIFALGFLDTVKGQLHLVRDRFGVKPLYVHLAGSELLFASELRPIVRKVQPSLNVDALATLLRLRYNPAPDTLWNGVQKLRPGHVATYDLRSQRLRIRPFVSRNAEPLKISFDEALEEYGRLVEAAVKRQLMADVEIGVLLSGGVDSAIVAHFAAKHYPERIKAFTVGYTQRSEQDETADAAYSANFVGAEHVVTRVSEENFQTILPKVVDIIEEPSATISAVPMYYLCQSVAPHRKVVLTGQGADEPLGGYFRYKSELLYQQIPYAAQLARLLLHVPKLYQRETSRRALLAWQERDAVKRFDESYAIFTTQEIEQLTGVSAVRSREYIAYYFNLMAGADRQHPVEAMMRNDLHMNLADDLLNYTDKISMHFGIEARVPFLDNELVDFADRLPVGYRLNLRGGKLIHKAFAEKILDKTITHRKKKGFGSPAQQWLKGGAGAAFRQQLTASDSPFAEHINPQVVARFFDDHQRRGFNREKQLFTLMSVYSWMNQQRTVLA